jgi:2-polyprenyl-3-methyl-5-hydroxy-6-metoxy-1,4-benzoquinol methylase
MSSNYRYLQELAESGYHTDNIDDLHTISIPYLARRFFKEKNRVILDVGSGWGHCLIPLKSAGYNNLYAVDLDASSREQLEREGIKFYHLNIEKEEIPFQDSTVDIVLSFHLIEHLHDPTNLLKEAFRILKDDGLLIMATPDWRKQYKTFWSDHTHLHPYDKISIVRLLSCFCFEVLWLRSFGVLRGVGRLGLWKFFNFLMFTGKNIIVVARKRTEST